MNRQLLLVAADRLFRYASVAVCNGTHVQAGGPGYYM